MATKKRILVVEDDFEHVRLLRLAFEEAELNVPLDVTKDGIEAMDFLNRHGPFVEAAWPALVLLDLNMGRMDGWEVLRKIRTRQFKFPLPVIIFSSTEDEDQILKAYALGANAFITKPMGFDGWINVAKTLAEFWFNVAQTPSLQAS